MAMLCAFLAAACCWDYKSRRIPNFLMGLMVIAGAGFQWLQGGGRGVLCYAGKALAAACLLYPLFRIGALGAGDVKLYGAAAGYLPFSKVFPFLFYSLLAAAVFSLLKMCKQRYFTERVKYFFSYLAEVAVTGSWKLYLENERERAAAGICLAGPALISIMLYLGGAY